MKIALYAVSTMFVLIAGCSGDDREAARPALRDNPVWGSQVRALEKAQGVESTIQSGADQRRQLMEEQTR